MLGPRVRRLYGPISVFVCLCILLTSLPGSVFRPRRRYTPYAGTTPPGQSGLPGQGNTLLPVMLSDAGMGPEVPTYPYDPPPRPPGLAQLLPLPGQTAPRVMLHASQGALVAMEPGWHLVSLPEQPASTDPAVVLASIAGQYARVYTFDGCDAADPWKLYDPADPAASDLVAIDHTMGLWIEMTAPGTLEVEGTRPERTDIPLCRGWNLVGYPQAMALPLKGAFQSIEGQYDRVFAWDPTNVEDPWAFFDVDAPEWANYLRTLRPGSGYWVHATEDTTLIVTKPVIPPEMDIPGCIEEPANLSAVSGMVEIVLDEDVTLYGVTVDYWPVNDLDAYEVLVTGIDGVGGSTLATLDTTVLANNSYAIRVSGTEEGGRQRACGVMVTVEGEYKPGRVRFTITDLTVPVVGLPISIGRTYDSLEREQVGEFGYGWSLAIANPKLEVDPDHNVTVTMPNGRRVTFYFMPTSVWGFLIPRYMPEAGVYGSLTAQGCELAVASGGHYFCFPGGPYQQSISTYTYEDPYGRQFVMGVNGKLRSIRDLNGNTLTFTPDGIQSSASGLEVTFARDVEGRIVAITDPLGNVYGYEYDAAGDLVSVRLPGVDEPVRYTYSPDHLFLSVEDPRGITLATATYYPDGRLQSETDALGNTYLYTYGVEDHTATVTNPDGGMETTTYDGYGMVLGLTDPLGRTTSFSYDENHNLISHTNGAGETASFTYDSGGNLTTFANPAGEMVAVTYNQYGGPTSVTDPLGNARRITYDARFMPANESDSLGVAATYTWDQRGSLIMRRQDGSQPGTAGGGGLTCHGLCEIVSGHRLNAAEPLSRTMSHTYDVQGNRISETDSLGRTTRYAYDVLGRVVSVTDAEGQVTRFEYDALDNLTAHIDALGEEAHFEYDAAGNRTAIVDPLGRRTSYEYDFLNRLVAVIYADGASTTFAYDFRGNALGETDPTGRVTRYEYDRAGQLIRMTRGHGTPEASTIHYAYDAAGRLIRETDALGHTTTYAYDAAGRLTAVTDPLGYTQSYTYDAAGQLVATTDADGRFTRNEYDVRRHRTSTTRADGSAAHYVYNAFGDLVEEVAACGAVTQYEYDAVGQLTQMIRAAGTPQASTLRYAYDNVGRLASSTDPLGNVTVYVYDAVGQLLSTADPLGNATTYAYDGMGHQISVEDARGNLTRYAYDARDRLVLTTYADSTTEERTYDKAGRLVEVIDQSGNVTHREYDATGRLVSVTRANGTEAASMHQYHYDLAGRMVGVTDPRGNLTRYVYDAAGRLEQVIDPLGYATTYTYDPAGQLLSTTDANGHQMRFDYDPLGRPVQTTYADGTVKLLDYDCGGRLLSTTDQAGKVTTYDYDAAGRLAGVTDALGQTTRYDYDPAGNLNSVTDANGHATSFAYDALGRRARKTWADGSFESFTYDPVGNLLSHRLADGNVNTFAYDAMDRLAHADYFDGQVFEYTYTPTGQRAAVSDGRGITRYAYDQQDRLTQVTQPDGLQVSYGYDAAGNRTSMTTPAGTIRYDYDAAGQLTGVTDPWGGETTFAYDPAGLRTQKNLPNGTSVDYDYDALDRLVSIVQHDGTYVLASYAYTLGPAGNRLSVTDENGHSIHWTYDDVYRLVEESFCDSDGTRLSAMSYTYDAVGNRLSQTANGLTTQYDYDALDRLLSAGMVQYEYDGRGNLIRITDGNDVTEYAWDALDRLAGVRLPEGTVIDYTYDADGRMVSQTSEMETTNYLWDEASFYGDVVVETDSGGAVRASYVLAGTELIAQRRGEETSYYLHDGQGSVRALTDAAGSVTDRYSYVAFGELLERQGATGNPYLYTGQRYDDRTGLYSLRARYYDPSDGRFLSRDPLEQLWSVRELNRYVYAANDPVNLTDPAGLQGASESGLLNSLMGIATHLSMKAMSGALISAGVAMIMYCLAVIGLCGPDAQEWAQGFGFWDFVLYVGGAAAIGGFMGWLGAAKPAAAAIVKIVAGGAGMVTSLYDILTNELNYCNALMFLMSLAAVRSGVRDLRAAKALRLAQPAQEECPTCRTESPRPGSGNCPGGSCSGDPGSPQPGGSGVSEPLPAAEAGGPSSSRGPIDPTRERVLYRGMQRGDPQLDTFMRTGVIEPRGGNATLQDHVIRGATDSEFTSWSLDPNIADFWTEPEGTIVQIRLSDVPNVKHWTFLADWIGGRAFELEITIVGPVFGAEVFP